VEAGDDAALTARDVKKKDAEKNGVYKDPSRRDV
jgi:hypothetical protein